MGNTKRQHYVPLSYLKRFSFDGTFVYSYVIRDGLAIRLTEEELAKICKPISIKDVCVAKDYYTLRSEAKKLGIDPLFLEKNYFQNYAEPRLNEIIDTFDDLAKQLLESNQVITPINMTFKQRLSLIEAAFIQYHRSPRSRHIIEEINEVIKHTYSLSQKESGQQISEEHLELDVAFTHADKTYRNPHLFRIFAEKLMGYSLMLRVSDNANFFTSDNPVVIHNLAAKGEDCFNVNFYRDEFTLFFPLTPYLMLEFYNPDVFPEAVRLNETISIVHSGYENQVNKYQYINAEKFVFSYKNDFSLFLKPIENHE